jgi:putative transposase
LRDCIQRQNSASYQAKRERLEAQQKLVEQIALQHPSYGYRLVYLQLQKLPQPSQTQLVIELPGLHKTRLLMSQQGLQAKTHHKRRKAPSVTPTTLWPQGRRLQMDATQVELANGCKRWVYSLMDVQTRSCLQLHPTHSLSACTAVEVLKSALQQLLQQGIINPNQELLIQTDGGSDFTSHLFQNYCQTLGAWVRAKVNQPGGMGILERMHRTFKYDYFFLHEVKDDSELKQICEGFMTWYNQQRPHSALGYQTPHALLFKPAV